MTLAEAMAKSTEQPICDQCAVAHGAKPPQALYIVTVSKAACCLCGHVRQCTALRDWKWPRTPKLECKA